LPWLNPSIWRVLRFSGRNKQNGKLCSGFATAQHIGHPLTQTLTFRIAEAGLVVKINIFAPGLQFQADRFTYSATAAMTASDLR